MSSISFDPVAHVYDNTRGYPSDVEQSIANGLEAVARASQQTSFIEVGVGTGRIALPLAALGHTYTGVDISEKMLAQFASKLLERGWEEHPQFWGSREDETELEARQVRRFSHIDPTASLRLVTSDITALPFADNSFDVAVAVHIFHLVDGWQQAVREVLRVLRPGALFLHCWDDDDDTSLAAVTTKWLELVEALGGNAYRVGAEAPRLVSDWLRAEGFLVEELAIANWESTSTPRLALERISSRLWSRTWLVPDEIFFASVQQLEAWALEHFGAERMDAPHTRMHQFIVHKAHM